MTRHPSIPLAGFLEAGGDPAERIPADRLDALAMDVARLWTPRHTAAQRQDHARTALNSYMATMVLNSSEHEPTPVDPDGRRVDEIVGLWTADLLRDGGLFLSFVGALPTPMRAEVKSAVMGET